MCIYRKPKSGRPRKTSVWQDRALARLVKKDPNKNASDVIDKARRCYGKNISQRTAQNILKRAKLFARRPARKPMLKEWHRKIRMEFAQGHKNWTAHEWGKVLWSDECKINLANPDGGQWIRRPSGKRFTDRYIKGTEKFGGGSIMVWGR